MNIAIFGCGKIGEETFNYYGKEKVEFFIDNNKVGEKFGKKIISFKDFLNIHSDYLCVISTIHYKEIIEQLVENEIENYIISPTIMQKRMPELSKNILHGKWIDYLVQLCDKENYNILEIGSREVSGDYFRDKFTKANYVGFDIYPGKNVDIVGDAHKLNTYFDKNTKFDLIFSSAVFEHLAMPWIVAEQIKNMLKVGGYVFVETHFAYSCHERPWHFFHFTDYGLQALFSPEAGFETVESGFSNPIDGRFSDNACEYLRGQMVPFLYCHSEFLGRKCREVSDFSWDKVDINKLVAGTNYPKPL